MSLVEMWDVYDAASLLHKAVQLAAQVAATVPFADAAAVADESSAAADATTEEGKSVKSVKSAESCAQSAADH